MERLIALFDPAVCSSEEVSINFRGYEGISGVMRVYPGL